MNARSALLALAAAFAASVAFAQETHDQAAAKACRIDGGHRATLPRSPIVPAGSDANA